MKIMLAFTSGGGTEAVEAGHSLVPYFVGGGILVFLLALLLALLAFGQGREHC